MKVDVLTEVGIDRPVAEVAAFACDPTNVPAWYAKISSVEWVTEPPVSLGSKIAFVAHFLGRRMAYTYEVVEWEPERRFVMATSDGPFPMRTTYTFEPRGEGTHMTLRNEGEPSGFASVTARGMKVAMRRANEKDLEALKAVLERS